MENRKVTDLKEVTIDIIFRLGPTLQNLQSSDGQLCLCSYSIMLLVYNSGN